MTGPCDAAHHAPDGVTHVQRVQHERVCQVLGGHAGQLQRQVVPRRHGGLYGSVRQQKRTATAKEHSIWHTLTRMGCACDHEDSQTSVQHDTVVREAAGGLQHEVRQALGARRTRRVPCTACAVLTWVYSSPYASNSAGLPSICTCGNEQDGGNAYGWDNED